MPKKARGSLGRKHKSRTQGSYSYQNIYASSPSRTASNKRRRHKRIGTSVPKLMCDSLEAQIHRTPESKRHCYRMAIFYQYADILDVPHSTYWKGMGGTISNIRHALQMRPNQRRVIRRTLEEIVRCMVEGVIFHGKIENKEKLGRKIIILPGSMEELLIANRMEAHCGFRMTTVMVNEHS